MKKAMFDKPTDKIRELHVSQDMVIRAKDYIIKISMPLSHNGNVALPAPSLHVHKEWPDNSWAVEWANGGWSQFVD